MITHVKYGIPFVDCAHEAEVELQMIRSGGFVPTKSGRQRGMGIEYHVKAFQKLAWPNKYWHRWNRDLIVPEFCKGGRLAIFGPSSSGKTSEAAAFALTMYWARPKGTTILVSTTSLQALQLRIWGEIKSLYREAKDRFDWLPGELIDSKHMLTTDGKEIDGRDLRDGLIGVACKRGNEWEGLSSFVGLKNDYVYLIADECHLMRQGFWDSLANLLSNPNCSCFALGNLNDTTSPLGKAAEPKLGWDSLPDSEKSRVYDTRWYGGRAIQLIGKDSPNLDFSEGQEPFPKLIGRRYMRQCEHDYGADTPLFNMFASGKIPRGLMEKRVLTVAFAMRHRAFEPVVWGADPVTKLYAMDAAYSGIGGDRTVGCPFGFGKDSAGVPRMSALRRPTIYLGSSNDSQSHEDAIALQCRAECENLGIPPARVFYDGTGRSSLTSSFARLWSPEVVPIEFGGRASNRPNFQGIRYDEGPHRGDVKPCRDLFGRFVSELWFAIVAMVGAEQARGLTQEMIEDGEPRLWHAIGKGKQDIETKEDMQKRTGRSPDITDMLACACEGARRLGFPLGKSSTVTSKGMPDWMKRLRLRTQEQDKRKELTYA